MGWSQDRKIKTNYVLSHLLSFIPTISELKFGKLTESVEQAGEATAHEYLQVTTPSVVHSIAIERPSIWLKMCRLMLANACSLEDLHCKFYSQPGKPNDKPEPPLISSDFNG